MHVWMFTENDGSNYDDKFFFLANQYFLEFIT